MALHGRRALAAAAAALLALAAATACTPTPEPTPTATPSGFASEAEAFAAAEATYRAYADAVNARRSDTESRPDPTDFLTGQAYNDEVDGERYFADRGWHLSGETVIASVTPRTADETGVSMTFCLDASTTRVLDANDTDVTPEDRADVLGVDVTFIPINGQLFVSASDTSAATC